MVSVEMVRSGAGPVVRILCALASFAAPASAESHVYIPYSGIERGTQGVAPVALSIANDTSAEIVCRVSLAHWYAADLGRAAPGGVVEAVLWHNPDTGALALLNDSRDRMPVEALWCGRAGAVHDSRAAIALPFAKGPAPDGIARRCVASGARLDCAAPD